MLHSRELETKLKKLQDTLELLEVEVMRAERELDQLKYDLKVLEGIHGKKNT